MSPSFDVETTSVKRDPVESRSVEFVERKGLGHPDTVCDGVAEAVSRSLSHRYREEFGRVLHHNTDSVQMVAGTAEPDFGGGEVLEQPTLYLGGQATKHAGDSTVPVEEIATEAARDYLDENLERIAAEWLWEAEGEPDGVDAKLNLPAISGDDEVQAAKQVDEVLISRAA